MVEENMVNTLLNKVGLPMHGTKEEKIARLQRNGFLLDKLVERAKAQEIMENPHTEVTKPFDETVANRAEIDPEFKEALDRNIIPAKPDDPMLPKRGRPKKK